MVNTLKKVGIELHFYYQLARQLSCSYLGRIKAELRRPIHL